MSDLEFSNVIRITNKEETLACDITEKNGKNSLCVLTDELFSNGVQANIIVGTSFVEAKCGVTKLSDRRIIGITPIDGLIYYGLNNSITVSNGTPIYKKQTLYVPFADVFLIASQDTNVRILEASWLN